MRTMDAAKAEMRNDFMTGHGKGGGKDMLVRQRPNLRQKLTDMDITIHIRKQSHRSKHY